jgi:hypothetical protein
MKRQCRLSKVFDRWCIYVHSRVHPPWDPYWAAYTHTLVHVHTQISYLTRLDRFITLNYGMLMWLVVVHAGMFQMAMIARSRRRARDEVKELVGDASNDLELQATPNPSPAASTDADATPTMRTPMREAEAHSHAHASRHTACACDRMRQPYDSHWEAHSLRPRRAYARLPFCRSLCVCAPWYVWCAPF